MTTATMIKPAAPIPRLPLMITAFAITAANFMNVLDLTIAVVAVPSISGTLGASPSQGTWILTIYSVCLAIVLPLSPWVCKRYGEVHTFTISVMMFSLTSWACGMSTSMETLVFFRALQGLSSGLIVPLSQTILLRIFPPEKHGMAIGLWSIASTIAPVLGPILGGVITDTIGWPWIFYLNIPIGFLAAWIVWTSMSHMETPIQKVPVDAVGMLLLATTVLLFQLVLDKGHELDWLASSDIRLMINIAVIALIGYIIWERKEPHPIIDYSLFKIPVFVIASVMAVIFNFTYFASTVLYPIWMQSALGYTATLSGWVMAGTSVLPIVGMMMVGKNIGRLNLRYLIISGTLVMMYAIYLQSLSSTDSTFGQLITARVVMGIGFTLMFPPLMVISLGSVSPSRTVSAASFFNFFRSVATSVGIAVGISLWQSRTAFHRQRLVEDLNPLAAEKGAAFAPLEQLSGGDEQVMWAMTDHFATVQASTMGINDTFIVCMLAAVPVLFLAMFIPAKLGPKPPDAPLAGE
ncbi:MAG: DHA2 family efflux MFS transporter permease subunit [Gammaproteobacteria bacterium]|nr:DHA2 family efflux MFS transporter permease subunit [Gammaproteobacteria bacterium]MBQ0839923.1 DHA2 family efflux MFS transporter permease subunit [Gammaproteobacteria bacterium]